MLIEVSDGRWVKLLVIELHLNGYQGIFHFEDKVDFLLIFRPPIKDTFSAILLYQFRKDTGLKNLADDFSLQPFQPEHLHDS
jgi:hypothetical protein